VDDEQGLQRALEDLEAAIAGGVKDPRAYWARGLLQLMSKGAAEPTIADFSLAGYQYYDEETSIDRAAFPNLLAWTQRIAQLPGWKHPYELMPRGAPDR